MNRYLPKLLYLLLALTLTAGCAGHAAEPDRTSLTIAVDEDCVSLSPADAATALDEIILRQIYDTLAMEDPANPTGTLLPRLAKKWEISGDGLDYTFHLRRDAIFHNGSAVTAADVGFSLDLCASSDTREYLIDSMSGWDTPDDYTIVVHTGVPDGSFLRHVTNIPIVCRSYYHTVGAETFAREPVGCGAYRFAGRKEDQSVTLRAFEDYYGGVPAIRDVTFLTLTDPQALTDGLKSGGIDFAQIGAADLPALEQTQRVTVSTAGSARFQTLAMNTQKTPLDDARIRQAINYAVNREALIAACADGQAVETSHLLTPEQPGWLASQRSYSYDPARARALLAEASYPDGVDVGDILVANSDILMAQLIQADLAEAGIHCTINALAFEDYLVDSLEGIYRMTCKSLFLSGDTQLMSRTLTEGYIGTVNTARWSDPRVERLFAQASVTIDEAERTAIYEEIFTIVQEEAAYCVLYNPTLLFAHDAALAPGALRTEGVYYLQEFAWT